MTRSCRGSLVGRDRADDSAVRDAVGTRPWIVDDELWALIEPLLPPWPERSPGPRPVPDRRCLQDILYVLHHDIAWQLLLPGAGVRLRADLPAPPGAVAAGRGLRPVAPHPAGRVTRGLWRGPPPPA
ncbi:transposase [Streptomyces hirsutus]|uniref:transposase n=1 Tax=Streptomyces hirsutus TaxID=35620 RepID=UPI0033BDE8A0